MRPEMESRRHSPGPSAVRRNDVSSAPLAAFHHPPRGIPHDPPPRPPADRHRGDTRLQNAASIAAMVQDVQVDGSPQLFQLPATRPSFVCPRRQVPTLVTLVTANARRHCRLALVASSVIVHVDAEGVIEDARDLDDRAQRHVGVQLGVGIEGKEEPVCAVPRSTGFSDVDQVASASHRRRRTSPATRPAHRLRSPHSTTRPLTVIGTRAKQAARHRATGERAPGSRSGSLDIGSPSARSRARRRATPQRPTRSARCEPSRGPPGTTSSRTPRPSVQDVQGSVAPEQRLEWARLGGDLRQRPDAKRVHDRPHEGPGIQCAHDPEMNRVGLVVVGGAAIRPEAETVAVEVGARGRSSGLHAATARAARSGRMIARRRGSGSRCWVPLQTCPERVGGDRGTGDAPPGVVTQRDPRHPRRRGPVHTTGRKTAGSVGPDGIRRVAGHNSADTPDQFGTFGRFDTRGERRAPQMSSHPSQGEFLILRLALLPIAIVATLSLVLAACGSPPAAPALTDPKDIVTKGVTSLKDIKTFEITGAPSPAA